MANLRLGRVEKAILDEVMQAGGWSLSISDHGRSTGAAIDRLEAKGLLSTAFNSRFMPDGERSGWWATSEGKHAHDLAAGAPD